jgi:hypothetical protein
VVTRGRTGGVCVVGYVVSPMRGSPRNAKLGGELNGNISTFPLKATAIHDLEVRMGLAERRSVERFKNDDYPGWKSRIDEAAGFEVPIEVAWEELAVADYADMYAEYFPQVYFQPLLDAFSTIAADDMGKVALREGMSKVVVRNSGEFFSPTGISFADGVLTFDHKSDTNTHHVEERTKALQAALESGL